MQNVPILHFGFSPNVVEDENPVLTLGNPGVSSSVC
jgi:hypothetical protein